MLAVATVVDWRLPITTMAWTWRVGDLTNTVMVDTREVVPAAVEEELMGAMLQEDSTEVMLEMQVHIR